VPDIGTRTGRYHAERGDVDAAYNLGVCYEEGRGVPVDYEAAFGWYAEAAAGGDADALFALGVCYNDGVGFPPSFLCFPANTQP
jgi:TPR repeat protein